MSVFSFLATDDYSFFTSLCSAFLTTNDYSFFEAFFFRPFSNFMLLLLAPLLFGQPFPEDGTPEIPT